MRRQKFRHYFSLAVLATVPLACSAAREESPEASERAETASARIVAPCPLAADYALAPPTLEVVDPLPLMSFPSRCDTQPLTRSPCTPHQVLRPAVGVVPEEALVLFLPGTKMEPFRQRYIVSAAAYAGYRTIGLSYDNSKNLAEACDGTGPATCDDVCANGCSEAVHLEVLKGNTGTSCRTVLPEDSVIVRTYRLLESLHANDSLEGWDEYFTPAVGPIQITDIVWDKIIVSGFSQGAGLVARLSKAVPVHGMVLIDGAQETCDGGTPVPWLNLPEPGPVAPPKFGVTRAVNLAPPEWALLGLGTTAQSIDGPGVPDIDDPLPPGLISHTAQLSPTPGCNPHGALADDSCMTTDFSGVTLAASPEQARLFQPYVNRFCYASP